MKKHLKVILMTALATSAAWVLGLAMVFWLLVRGPQPKGDYFAHATVPSYAEAPSALVIEQFAERWSGAHTEIFRRDIPPGEQRHFAFRVVQTSSPPVQRQ